MRQVGQLRHRITIQEATENTSDSGAVSLSWSDKATVWASVEPLSGDEAFNAQQVQAELSHKIIIRHKDDITTKDRIIFNSRTFDIYSVINPQERGRYLEIEAMERK